MNEFLFTKDHEWIKVSGNEAIIGISDYAQSELGEIVFVELPSVGSDLKKEEVFGTVEAVKAVSDLFMPVSGGIVEVNSALEDKPELVNESPYEEGWMIKVLLYDAAELGQLMTEEQYQAFIKG
jgi:glycine cleavage system H protein